MPKVVNAKTQLQNSRRTMYNWSMSVMKWRFLEEAGSYLSYNQSIGVDCWQYIIN